MHAIILDDRAVLRVSGAETRAFLQGLVTNDVDRLAPGTPMWAGLLSAQGKALFDMILHAADDAVLIDVALRDAPALAKRLAMYRLRRAVTIEPSELAVHAAWGPGEGPPDPRLAALGSRWVAAPDGLPDAIAYDRHRLALGVPGPDDLGSDRTLWLEANAVELNGVSFTKGCYVGQENTARMHHKDKLRRRLLPVALTADPGSERVILAGDRAAGELRSFRDGLGIAYMRLEHASPPLTLGGSSVSVTWPPWLATP